MTLTLATINVRSIYSELRSQSIFPYLKSIQADIFCLQECCIPHQRDYYKWEAKWCFKSLWSGSNENKNDGVAILVNSQHITIEKSIIIRPGRAQLVEIKCRGNTVKILNIYGYNEKEERFQLFRDLEQYVMGRDPTIICGDFNCVLEKEDRLNPHEDFKKEKTALFLKKLCRDFKLEDICKNRFKGQQNFTWYSADGKRASRIDYIFAKQCQTQDIQLIPVFFSDHVMIKSTLLLPKDSDFGKGVWKLNCSLLKEKKIVEKYKEEYKQWQTIQDLCDTKLQWWELIKKRTRTFFMKEGNLKKRHERNKLLKLQKRLQTYFKLQMCGLDFHTEISSTKKEIKELMENRAMGVIIRSKEQEVEEGEKCTRYFFKKIIDGRHEITELRNKDGKIIQDNQDISTIVQEFYTDLYAYQPIKNYIVIETLAIFDKKIQTKQNLEKDFDVVELTKCMKKFKKGKSPGIDGLPIEFYETFWDLIARDILEMFNEFQKMTVLPETFTMALVKLIHKKGEKIDLKNWRPISLLNVDYKLFSKLLASRLTGVLDQVIHPDQLCAVPGRRITDGLILVRDIIHYSQERRMQIMMVNLDFEKAFDSISHEYMFKILDHIDCPKIFIKWITLLYTQTTNQILIQGNLTSKIKIQRGVRQGCPLSALLYILCIEPLAQTIRMDQHIRGFGLPGCSGSIVKCILYMDDINVICSDSSSANRVFQLVEIFGNASGSKLNREKTQIIMYGPWREDEKNKWEKNTFDRKILGIKFDKDGYGKQNWIDLTHKIKKKIAYWSLRAMTIEGKVLIIKAVILAMLRLTSIIFFPPKGTIRTLERNIFYFLWNTKWERLKRSDMKKDKENGGKGVPDIYVTLGSYYVATHLKILTQQEGYDKTRALTYYELGMYLRQLKLLPKDLKRPVAFNMPPAYKILRNFLRDYNIEQEPFETLCNHKAIMMHVKAQEEICKIKKTVNNDWKATWSYINDPILPNRLKDFMWMVAHEILPARAVMHARGMAKTDICPRAGCNHSETVSHVLWTCEAAVNLWAIADSQKFPHLPEKALINEQLVMYGVGLEKFPKKVQKQIWLTIVAINDASWATRNLLVRSRRQIPPVASLQIAITTRRDATKKNRLV